VAWDGAGEGCGSIAETRGIDRGRVPDADGDDGRFLRQDEDLRRFALEAQASEDLAVEPQLLRDGAAGRDAHAADVPFEGEAETSMRGLAAGVERVIRRFVPLP
jgi:hypothetical protein